MIPDMPSAQQLLPWLEQIDAARWYTNFGPLVRELEQTMTRHWPVTAGPGAPLQVVTLNTGTAPLELGIDALRLAPGAHVLIPALTFAATAAAVTRAGLVPVMADVDAASWQLTPAIALHACAQFELALVMPVATFGCPVAVDAWDAFSEQTGIPVLIDAAAAFGNQAVGARTSVAFSFHATKPFGIGEGGAYVTRDAELAAHVRRQSNFGFEHALVHHAGGNAKMSEYAAAVGLAQWQRLRRQWALRAELWVAYSQALADIPGVVLQQGFAEEHLPATLVVRLPVPVAAVAAEMAALGIETRRWYYPPLYCHPAFANSPRCGADGELPETARLAEFTLGLPWHAHMSANDCAEVAAQLRRLLAQQDMFNGERHA